MRVTRYAHPTRFLVSISEYSYMTPPMNHDWSTMNMSGLRTAWHYSQVTDSYDHVTDRFDPGLNVTWIRRTLVMTCVRNTGTHTLHSNQIRAGQIFIIMNCIIYTSYNPTRFLVSISEYSYMTPPTNHDWSTMNMSGLRTAWHYSQVTDSYDHVTDRFDPGLNVTWIRRTLVMTCVRNTGTHTLHSNQIRAGQIFIIMNCIIYTSYNPCKNQAWRQI